MNNVDGKNALNLWVGYATDRSKVLALLVFLFCVALFFYYGAFHVESCLALCSRVVFSVL